MRILGTFTFTLAMATCCSGQLWISNPNNPYDEFGERLREHWLAMNQTFASQECPEVRACLGRWTQQLNLAYHADPNAFMVLDRNKITVGTRETDFIEQVTRAITTGDVNQSLNKLKLIENAIVAAYQGSPDDSETEAWLLLFTTSVKYLEYTFATEGITLGGWGPDQPGFCWSCWGDAIDGCIGAAAGNSNPIDIIVNWGAGPGGWVLGTALGCAYSTF